MASKLKDSVTFLPLTDLRFSRAALRGHTWFISTMFDKQEEEVQFQRFPSESSKGRLLCLKGNDQHDSSWNYYALAWPEALPRNSTLKKRSHICIIQPL
ncbi:glycosyltransferase [Lithospermum erythrorhizon]|uniref:Glycosyltransferase n=1 Tax=Lithospermum erythrorhizon TaxID=34254 RepID=A0AAV3NKF0_LITER